MKFRRSWEDLSERLPVDVYPCSNGEFVPPPPTRQQRMVMELAEAETERWRRKFGMNRRDFVRSAAAMTIGFWAIDAIGGRFGDTRFGSYASAHNTATTDACDLEWAGRKGLETLHNLPGEFIFDVQSHHVEPERLWRVTNPAINAFFAAVWPQSSAALGDQPGIRPDGSIRGGGAGELDPIANLSRYHYLKELFLDSATTMTVLSAVPTAPDINNPLPIADAAHTVDVVNRLAHSQRTVMHAFVMPNRGSMGDTTRGLRPPFLTAELDLMEERASEYHGFLRGWKTYCPWGDVPYASGWFLDSAVGDAFLEQVRRVHQRHPSVPPLVATHKGFALPGFDQRAATPRDVGPAAKRHRDVRFVIYHSGHDTGDTQLAYPGDAAASSSTHKVDALIKSLRENHWDASRFREKGKAFGNVPNVWAELGSVWRDAMDSPDQAAHLLGKLITHVGPKRVVWGTDSLWYGSPQREIVALRRFEFTARGKELYNLPYGLEGDVEDPTKRAPTKTRTIRNAIFGRNGAEAYSIDPDARRHAIGCDAVQPLHNEYVVDALTARERAPLASNRLTGARTRRELLASLKTKPWGP
jgi:hypothetical protein